jgi:hypothetical protein
MNTAWKDSLPEQAIVPVGSFAQAEGHKAISGEITWIQAAEILGVTPRHMRRRVSGRAGGRGTGWPTGAPPHR